LRTGSKAEYVEMRWREQQEGKGELHNEILHHLYSSPKKRQNDQVKDKIAATCSINGGEKNTTRFQWGNLKVTT